MRSTKNRAKRNKYKGFGRYEGWKSEVKKREKKHEKKWSPFK
jgi:hypothetical protein